MSTTYHTQFLPNGTPVGVPNEIAKSTKEFYVSYNNFDTSLYGSDTTAICVARSSAFLVLNGDHRSALKDLSYQEACAYFHSRPELKNKFSDPHEDDFLKIVEGKAVYVRIPHLDKAPV